MDAWLHGVMNERLRVPGYIHMIPECTRMYSYDAVSTRDQIWRCHLYVAWVCQDVFV